MNSCFNLSAWPTYSSQEIQAVTKVLESGKVNYWTGGEGRQFEQEFASYHDAPYGVAVANGTLALELALIVLEIGSGDEVVVTPRTFLASASAIVAVGAVPVFADVDPVSQNITPGTVLPVVTAKTKAVITVHLAGWPCDMQAFRTLADEHGLLLIEDCAQAHGAVIDGKKVGSWGDAAAFSFCQDKIMSTGGEGGMLLLQDEAAWKKAWSYKDHGKDWDGVYNTDHPPGFRWLHHSFGTNWRLTEMQSALGRIQLSLLPEWLEKRRHFAAFLNEKLSSVAGLRLTVPPNHIEHAYYKYYAFVEPDKLKSDWSRDRVIAEVNARDVFCQQGSCSEIYLEKAFDGHSSRPQQRLPVAQQLGETSLLFQVHPTLTDEHIEQAANALVDVMKAAVK